MRTIHSAARQARSKVMKNWAGSSLEAYNMKISELESQLREMEKCYQSKLKDKQNEFERWIVAKEAVLETEVEKRKLAEEKLSSIEKDESNLKEAVEKLKSQNKTTAVLQKTLSEKIVENTRLSEDNVELGLKLQNKTDDFNSF